MCFKIESINRSMGRSQRQNGNKNNGDNKVRREKEKEIKKKCGVSSCWKKVDVLERKGEEGVLLYSH